MKSFRTELVWVSEDGEVPLKRASKEQLIEIIKELHAEVMSMRQQHAHDLEMLVPTRRRVS